LHAKQRHACRDDDRSGDVKLTVGINRAATIAEGKLKAAHGTGGEEGHSGI